ncbi:MAG: hypothetical protein AAF491_11045 [Verrucomicrobiota bacterium]
MARRTQLYLLRFVAKPDGRWYQIQRLRSAKWPKNENLYLQLGEVSPDNQIRLKAYQPAEPGSSGAQLTILHLPTNTEHVLIQKKEYSISTHFAELQLLAKQGESFFVKEGDEFRSPEFPGINFRLVSASESSAVLWLKDESGEVRKFVVEKE